MKLASLNVLVSVEHYFLMLVFMLLNGGLCLAVLSGIFLGSIFFPETTNLQCDSDLRPRHRAYEGDGDTELLLKDTTAEQLDESV